MQTAKVFMSGRSQAVRLPKAFRFNTEQVFITKQTDGKIILSDKPITENGWGDFFDLLNHTDVPEDFIQDLQRRSTEQNHRDPLAELAKL